MNHRHADRWLPNAARAAPSAVERIAKRRCRPAFPAEVVASCLLGLLSFAGCAGWQVGHQTLYRSDIRTVYVPMIESDSLRRNLGEWLTEMVVKEIELKTPYKVVHTPSADSVLTARLTSDRKRVIVEDPNDEARAIDIEFVVQVNWFDRTGQLLMQNTFTDSGTLIPEGGESVTTAQQYALQRIAEQIVSRLETPNW